jgi:hypothetical protein
MIANYKLAILDDFTKRENIVCTSSSDYYGFYRSTLDAKIACNDDQECGKIYDAGCHGKAFKLCKKDTKTVPSKEGSCLHERNIMGNLETTFRAK